MEFVKCFTIPKIPNSDGKFQWLKERGKEYTDRFIRVVICVRNHGMRMTHYTDSILCIIHTDQKSINASTNEANERAALLLLVPSETFDRIVISWMISMMVFKFSTTMDASTTQHTFVSKVKNKAHVLNFFILGNSFHLPSIKTIASFINTFTLRV